MSGRGEAVPLSSLLGERRDAGTRQPSSNPVVAPPAEREVTPDWKPEKRKKATTKRWGEMRRGLNERCLVCGDPAQSAHHIVRKAQGGDDVPANLAALCGHGTRGCHGLVEARHRPTLSTLRYALSDDQLDYVLKKKGQAWFDRAYPKPDCVVCDDLGCSHCPSVPKEAA